MKWVRRLIKLLFSRVVLVAICILLQIAYLIIAIWQFSQYFAYTQMVLTLLSFIVVIHIINDKSNPAYKLAWIVPIMAFPIFGGLFYIFFGGNKAGRRIQKKLTGLMETTEAMSSRESPVIAQLDELDPRVALQARYIQDCAMYSTWTNTTVKYHPSGEEQFEDLKAELEKAEHYIFLEYFIIHEGIFWDTILEILVRKAREGVDVRLIYDDLGCVVLLPYGYDRKLEKLGIQCKVFNPFVPFIAVRMNNRDHRKIVVIDGHTAFTGGINLADEYINAYEKFGHWKDTGVMVKGEAVWNFTVMFLTLWDFLTKKREPDYERFRPQVYHPEPFAGEGFVAPFTDSPMDGEAVGENVYYNLIAHACRYVYITTPYLILDYEMTNALCTAAKSGVDVRIITPHVWDKFMVYMLTQSNYPALLEAGVKIYEYTPGFVHAKSFVVDDELATVGTINLDYRSLYLHFECGWWMYKTSAVMDIKEDLLKTMEECHCFTMEDYRRLPLYRRLGGKLLKLFAPLL